METSEETNPRHLPWIAAVTLLGLLIAAVAIGINAASETTGAAIGAENRMAPEDAAAFAALVASGRDGMVDTGMHHMHMGSDPEMVSLSPAEAEELSAELALATAATANYDTVEKATAAGYVPISPYVDGVGSHWTKWSLVDQPFDIERPSQLLFEEITWGAGPELVAFSYWVLSDEEPEGFAGGTDQWHSHLGLCFEDGMLTTENNPDPSTCNGDWISGENIWMLHAWIVPGMENRFGVFHSVNPRLCERYCE